MRGLLLALGSLALLPLILPAHKPLRSSSPIVPAYLGLWEAKEVFVPDAQGHLRVDEVVG